MSAVVITELALGVLVALALAFLVFVWGRRRVIGGGRPLLVAALRTAELPRWKVGLMRLGDEHLEWFHVVGPRFRPVHRLNRHQVELTPPRPVAEAIPGLPSDAVTVGATNGGHAVELAYGPGVSTAVRAWLESQPPGFNVNVAN